MSAETKGGAFAKHKPSAVQSDDENATRGGMPLIARFLIFVFVPSFTGLVGLGVSYLQTMYDPEKKVDFDRDFVTPFLLSMAFVIVLGFQTGGFAMGANDSRRKGAFSWPKTRTVQKIRRERVIVDDDADKKEQ